MNDFYALFKVRDLEVDIPPKLSVAVSVSFVAVAPDVASRRRKGAPHEFRADCRYHACWHQYAHPLQATAGEQRNEAKELQELLAVGTVSLAALGLLLLFHLQRRYF
jgi:hypothetical protein